MDTRTHFEQITDVYSMLERNNLLNCNHTKPIHPNSEMEYRINVEPLLHIIKQINSIKSKIENLNDDWEQFSYKHDDFTDELQKLTNALRHSDNSYELNNTIEKFEQFIKQTNNTIMSIEGVICPIEKIKKYLHYYSICRQNIMNDIHEVYNEIMTFCWFYEVLVNEFLILKNVDVNFRKSVMSLFNHYNH